MSTISVIIPCYRDSKTLARALDSVYAQTRLPDEVIVVNDCSPETEEIEFVLRSYPKVIYELNKTNVGLAASRNRGIERSKCTVVSFLDADDILHPQKIEFQSSVLKNGCAVSCAYQRIGATEVVSTRNMKFGNLGCIRTFTKSSEIIYRNRLTGAAIMAYKVDLEAMGGYDSSLRSCEDYDLWLRLLDAGFAVLHLRRPLYLYRLNDAGLSRATASISRWEMETISKALARKGFEPPFEGEAAKIWAFWILKHIIRNRASNSEAVTTQIDLNMLCLKQRSMRKMGLALARNFVKEKNSPAS